MHKRLKSGFVLQYFYFTLVRSFAGQFCCAYKLKLSEC